MERKPEIFSVEFEDFSGSASQKLGNIQNDIAKLADLKLKVIAQLGTSKSNIGEVSKYKVGDYIEVDRMAGHTVNIYVGEEKIAIGEVILMDKNFGLRVTEVISKKGEFLKNISKNGEIE
ncbi:MULTISPECIES: FliM/FliN family flagellar motor switch protein [Bacillus cereus group]|uniref:FliM/FliN family flagellar motor switch protein n=1 Tax=Bacillus cereus group TaxID=86661 RepID=UPI0014828F72|nr:MULTISPECIES: FliM/FliN family flagellar motor switch protein [Bacillus cereus group]MDA1674915.1 FliM/FliN family flagellar motor switch protein [Bacillus cereus group sp. TH152-1LC]